MIPCQVPFNIFPFFVTRCNNASFTVFMETYLKYTPKHGFLHNVSQNVTNNYTIIINNDNDNKKKIVCIPTTFID